MLKILDPSRNRYAAHVFSISVLCGPVALLIAVWAGWNASTKQPPAQEQWIHLNEVTAQVQLFGDQIVRLAMTGRTAEDRKTLASMVADPRAVELSKDPWNVTSSHVIGVARIAQQADSAEWKVTVRIGYTAPGDPAVRFNTMNVIVLSSDGGYKAAALPMMGDATTVPIQVGPGYNIPVDPNSGLGDAVTKFATAYYVRVPGSTKAPDLGRFVTGDFPPNSAPLTSPFTSLAVPAIYARAAVPTQPSPGDSADVLATVKGSASASTSLNMQIPLQMVFTEQRQWAVARILSTVDVGQIIHR